MTTRSSFKFGWISGEERRYYYPNVFAVEKTSGPERLIIAPSEHHVSILIDLISVMSEPIGILYVLKIPRSDSEPGRYQAANSVSRGKAQEFFTKFREYFENDGRHHIWIASMSSSDQLVYDNHNVIYAYGQLEEFQRIVLGHGLACVESVQFPVPHAHHYHDSYDLDERSVLRYWDWTRTPLRESDQ